MVLEITVKTLDSQNYQFEANDDWTVKQFKEHIQSQVNLPPAEQRLIFCGRVLEDDKKLSEYDCNGKVIHLVRRPPPPLQDPAQNSGTADSNNNSYVGRGADNGPLLDENNPAYARAFGTEPFMQHMQRHLMTIQQAFYSRGLADVNLPIGSNLEPLSMTDVDRHLHNASRLLRITVTAINECMARIAALPPIESRPTFERPTIGPRGSVIAAASSHTDLRRADDTQTNDNNQDSQESNDVPRSSVDDMGVSAVVDGATRGAARQGLPRQSLTTDDLPPSSDRPAPRIIPVTVTRARNDGRSGSSSTRQRGQSELDQYISLMNHSNDIETQFHGLARRYRQLVSMARRGGLIVPETQSTTNLETERSVQGSQQNQASSTLMEEANILGSYIPRIMHHLSHLQHALSDFTIDFARGRLLLSPSTRSRHSARRSIGVSRVNPASSPGLNAPRQSWTTLRPDSTLQGSVTITATTLEGGSSRPEATLVVTSEPGGQNVQIPFTFPLPPIGIHGQSLFIGPRPPNAGNSEPTLTQENQGQQAPAQETSQENPQGPSGSPARSIGVLSGRIPLPFDYYLPCSSQWANYSVTNRSASTRRGEPQSSRSEARPRTTGTNPASNTATSPEARPGPNPVGQQEDRPAGSANIDLGLTDLVSSILGSIFRPLARGPIQTQNESVVTQDPMLGIDPGLLMTTAREILGSVLGTPNQAPTVPNNQQRPTSRPQQPASTSTASVMMDIDIDDSSSSQSESRYQDARDSSSPSATASNLNSASRQVQSQHTQPGLPGATPSTSSTVKYNRRQLVEAMQNHPDWIPIIEADIDVMEQQQRGGANSQPSFSDAYLNSIPRKRRRLLTTNPDRVLILHPSSSQAISNLLRRAITSSSTPNIGSLDQVLGSISDDLDLQSAYEDYIKSAVEARLKTDYDYCPQKFENSSKYFK